MNAKEAKPVLLRKAQELSQAFVSKDEIAMEQNAEILDAIQQTADREIALDSLSRNWRTAALVSQALQRIETGAFGICAECEEPIAEKRLKALPWAKYCITCQEWVDRVDGPVEIDVESLAA